MRPLKLMMQAFGPYADTEIIDFSQLESRTMFVISGKTGAGKTSIFDGISFAIYGKASGEDREGMDLRSHFAKDHVPTEVALEFSLRNQTYYVWRSPQQLKKKTRGDGYTVINAKAELYIFDESGSKKLLAANVRDTEEAIKEIIQLDANQFRKILMIPQGDFRKFLTSNSKEKEVILQRLFHTEMYKKVEESLKDKANDLKNEVRSGIDLRSQTIKGAYTYGNEELETAISEKMPNKDTVLPLLDQVTKQMEEETLSLAQKIEQKQRERDEAKRKVHEAENLLKEIEAFQTLKRKKVELDHIQPVMEAKKKEIKMAYKANNLEHQEAICRRLHQDLKEHENKLKQLEANMEATEKEKSEAKKRLEKEEENEERREWIKVELARLNSIQDDVYSYEKQKNHLLLLENQVKDIRAQIDNHKKTNQSLEKEIAFLQKEMQEFGRLQTETVQLELEQVRLKNTYETLCELMRARQEKNDLQRHFQLKSSEWKIASKKLDDARTTLEHVEKQWQSGQAALLAKHLVDGRPCPVCGSPEHPHPAQMLGSMHNEDDIRAAKSDVQILEKEYQELERSMIELKTSIHLSEQNIEKLMEEVKRLFPNFEQDRMDSELKRVKERLEEMAKVIAKNNAAISKLPATEGQFKEKEAAFQKLHEELESLMDRERKEANELAELSAHMRALTKNIPEELSTIEKFNEKVALLKRELNAMELARKKADEDFRHFDQQLAALSGVLKNLQETINEQKEKLRVEREAFLKQLEHEGFSSYRHYEQAKREPDIVEKLEKEIQTYGEDVRSVTDRLKEYEHRLKDVKKPDLKQLEEECRELERTLEGMNERQTGLVMNIKKNKEIKTAIMQMDAHIKSLEDEYELIGHLADIARGQNAYKLTFERYVLASFLDEILVSANHRLTKMTSGRYRLLRKKDKSKGNIQSGLELLIFDEYTGQERHVKTLSGGESFKAALSLALGMADIVQRHAGGVSLETMFIDEGFGTLDSESLDQAIEALMDIQSSGRLVGIISHVPELKERIDARLEVLAGQSGSSTEFVFS